MKDFAAAGIRKLQCSDLASVNYMEDIRGQQVVDCRGAEIGRVDALFIDESKKKVRFFRVSAGRGPEGGVPKFLIPVDAVGGIGGGTIRIDRPREGLAVAPPEDSVLQNPRNVEFVYGHYGCPPFWTPGYAYPRYPYYV